MADLRCLMLTSFTSDEAMLARISTQEVRHNLVN
jgi:hypothetical protein